MTLIVKTVTKIMAGLILLFGIYLVLHGHLTPGGGFSGGVVIAGAYVLWILALGTDQAWQKAAKLRTTLGESVGALLFWLMAMLGLFAGTLFFLNLLPKGEPWELLSSGTIPFCNVAIAFKVGAGLLAIFMALVVLKMGEKK